MSDFEIVAGVFVSVFILGIGVGVTIVIALSAVRLRRHEIDLGRRQKHGPDDRPPRPGWPRGGGFRG